MDKYYVINMSGELQIVTSLSGYDGCKVLGELNKLPEVGEFWNPKTKSFVKNEAFLADAEAGAEHIAKAHLIKQLEAAIVLSGYELDAGILHEEAKALGIETLALAKSVMKNAKGFIDKETLRRRRKNA